MPSNIINDCSRLLTEQGLTIAFVESVSAGRMAAEFSLTEDSGKILKGGIVSYDAEVKEDLLGIDPAYIEQYTPESAEVTKAMAMGLKSLIDSDVQVAVTGLSTPGGSESAQKPVGTIFIHILIRERSLAVRRVFDGSPEQIVLKATDLVAKTIIDELKSRW
jgi:nicotinamide-nucleotide amidase